MIKIDKNIPFPARPTGRGQPPKYPWKQMEVGDSFYIDQDSNKFRNSPNGCTRGLRKKGWLFSIRKEGTGSRVWRIK